MRLQLLTLGASRYRADLGGDEIGEVMQPGRYTGGILLADISGYSSFLIDVQTAHSTDAFADGQVPAAYAMMAGLLEGIAAKVDPPLTFLKFEGDAAFAVAPDGVVPVGAGMIDCVLGCYADFTARKAAVGEVWTCTCDACSREGSLDLKFIVHHGEFFVQHVGGHLDAVGPEINVAHRLLKNNAAAMVGTNGYALFTDEAVSALDLSLAAAAVLSETVDEGRNIGARVIRLAE